MAWKISPRFPTLLTITTTTRRFASLTRQSATANKTTSRLMRQGSGASTRAAFFKDFRFPRPTHLFFVPAKNYSKKRRHKLRGNNGMIKAANSSFNHRANRTGNTRATIQVSRPLRPLLSDNHNYQTMPLHLLHSATLKLRRTPQPRPLRGLPPPRPNFALS